MFWFQTQDRRKSYTRGPKHYNRKLVADSEHEDDDEKPAEEVKKAKKTRGKSRKKHEGPKEKSAVSTLRPQFVVDLVTPKYNNFFPFVSRCEKQEEEELEKFAEEFNTHCEEVEQFEVPVVPE